MSYLITDLAWHEILHRHFRPSQSLKWITAKWLTHGKQLQEVAVWGKLENPLLARPILIYFEFRSKPSLITVICMDPHSPNKLFATNYCFLILEDDTSFFFLIISLFFVFFFILLFYAILLLLNFTKTMLLLLLFYFINFFFRKITFIFSCSGMFRDDPACSGMFRVPGFIDAPAARGGTFQN